MPRTLNFTLLFSLGLWMLLAGPLRSAPAGLHPLDQFLADRPAPAVLIRRYPALEQALRAQLDRSIGGCRLLWSDEPPLGTQAQHIRIRDKDGTHLEIRVSDRLVPTDQVLGLYYESLNAEGLPRFQALEAQASAHKITRDQFIDGILAIEHDALIRTQETFPKLMPLSPFQIRVTSLYIRVKQTPKDFRASQAWAIRTKSANYARARESYGQAYDRLLAPKTD
jgi:hypothetical protein